MDDTLQEAYRAPPYIEQLIFFWSDDKQTISGWDKLRKNDVKFQIHGPFELGS